MGGGAGGRGRPNLDKSIMIIRHFKNLDQIMYGYVSTNEPACNGERNFFYA